MKFNPHTQHVPWVHFHCQGLSLSLVFPPSFLWNTKWHVQKELKQSEAVVNALHSCILFTIIMLCVFFLFLLILFFFYFTAFTIKKPGGKSWKDDIGTLTERRHYPLISIYCRPIKKKISWYNIAIYWITWFSGSITCMVRCQNGDNTRTQHYPSCCLMLITNQPRK